MPYSASSSQSIINRSTKLCHSVFTEDMNYRSLLIVELKSGEYVLQLIRTKSLSKGTWSFQWAVTYPSTAYPRPLFSNSGLLTHISYCTYCPLPRE